MKLNNSLLKFLSVWEVSKCPQLAIWFSSAVVEIEQYIDDVGVWMGMCVCLVEWISVCVSPGQTPFQPMDYENMNISCQFRPYGLTKSLNLRVNLTFCSTQWQNDIYVHKTIHTQTLAKNFKCEFFAAAHLFIREKKTKEMYIGPCK